MEIGEVTSSTNPKKADKVATTAKPFEGKEGRIDQLFRSKTLFSLINY